MRLGFQPSAISQHTRIILNLLLLGVLLTAVSTQAQNNNHRLNLPLVVKSSTAPKASSSYYVTKITDLPLYQLKGCISAVELQEKEIASGFIAFLYGRPAYLVSPIDVQGEYGTYSVQQAFLDLPFIKESMKLWIRGFIEGFHEADSLYECGLRNDAKITQPKVILSISTTNEPLKIYTLPDYNQILNDITLEGHGYVWGDLVNELNDYIDQNGWKNLIEVVGGNDIEIDFNTPEQTKLWIKGYYSATFHRFYHLGDCAGCPDPQPWTLLDLWQVTSGVYTPIVPQIYRVDGYMAVQWSQADRTIRDTPDPNGDFPDSRLRPLYVWGVLTQHKACDDRGSDLNPPISGKDFCMNQGDDFYNTPQQAWDQLTDQYQTQKLGQPFSKATDVGYNWNLSRFRK